MNAPVFPPIKTGHALHHSNMDATVNLLPNEAAARLRLSTSTLAHWRVSGEGPRFIKWGRKVLYPLAELEAFERGALHTATSVRVKETA